MFRSIVHGLVLLAVCGSVWAEDIQLPEPRKAGGKPLLEALNTRKSTRVFSDQPLHPKMLSNLLWAAFGVSHSGRRTAPSAYNCQEIDLYVALSEGVFIYRAKPNLLEQVSDEDIRDRIGGPKGAKRAPVHLIYVADYGRMKTKEEFYSATDTGFISQNVYLFCSSERLNTVVLGGANQKILQPLLKLNSSQHIILTQPVGYRP